MLVNMLPVASSGQASNEGLFTKSINGLLKVSEQVIRQWERGHFTLNSSKDPVRESVMSYKRGIDKIPVSVQIDQWTTFYEGERDYIIQDFEYWLMKNATMTLTQDDKSLSLPLSRIYRKAVELRDQTMDAMGGIAKSFASGVRELAYPDAFKLHLGRICSCVAPSKDQGSLRTLITQMEHNLNIAPTESAPTLPTEAFAQLGSAFGNIKIPGADGQTIDVGPTLQTMLNQPQIQGIITNIMGQAQSAQNLNEFVSSITTQLADPELTRAINETITPTVLGAQQQVEKEQGKSTH